MFNQYKAPVSSGCKVSITSHFVKMLRCDSVAYLTNSVAKAGKSITKMPKCDCKVTNLIATLD